MLADVAEELIVTIQRDAKRNRSGDASRNTAGAQLGNGPAPGRAPMVQRRSSRKHDKPPIQRKEKPGPVTDHSADTLASTGGGSAIPAPVRSQMESSFGTDFSSVRLHQGSQASSIGAQAYTQGENIHFAPGEMSLGSQTGKSLLGHELTHVVQQRAGRVSLPQGKGATINADAGLEREADVLGDKAARGERVNVQGSSAGLQRKATSAAPVQRKGRKGKLRDEADQTGSKLNILKVTVAGSGDLVWKTHKGKIDEKGWEQVKARDKLKSFEKETESGGVVTRELSFSGPLSLGGMKDDGSNSIKKLIKNVPERVHAAVQNINHRNQHPIRILLRAHSRGAVAGSHIANALAGKNLKDGSGNPVKLEVVLFDPVPGPGHSKKYQKIKLDPHIDQSTVVYSVKSGYAAFFDPAKVLSAKRIIVTGEPHSAGIQHGFMWKGDRYSGSDLSSLEEGVYVERSSQQGVLRKANDIGAARRRIQRTFKSIDRSGGSDVRSRRIKKVLMNYYNNG